MFKELFSLEKIHGTSSHLSWKFAEKKIHFSSGGANHVNFLKLFDQPTLLAKFLEMFPDRDCTVFGEAYGGKLMGMSAWYGPHLRFAGFDVKVSFTADGQHDEVWLSVVNAHDVCSKLGLDFVDYAKIPATLEAIDAERDRPSTQAIKNGMGDNHIREGVVLRPIVECTLNNGGRIICKHKRKEFMETKTPREVNDADVQVLDDARAIAEEWVVEERLRHVLDKLPQDIGVSGTADVVKAMLEDVSREAEGEIVMSKEARKSISNRTAFLFHALLKRKTSEVPA
jgi:hypothetical protein